MEGMWCVMSLLWARCLTMLLVMVHKNVAGAASSYSIRMDNNPIRRASNATHVCIMPVERNESLRPLMISSEGIVMPST